MVEAAGVAERDGCLALLSFREPSAALLESRPPNHGVIEQRAVVELRIHAQSGRYKTGCIDATPSSLHFHEAPRPLAALELREETHHSRRNAGLSIARQADTHFVFVVRAHVQVVLVTLAVVPAARCSGIYPLPCRRLQPTLLTVIER
jgi:hypothetical protein